jgi:hypothetical protein
VVNAAIGERLGERQSGFVDVDGHVDLEAAMGAANLPTLLG